MNVKEFKEFKGISMLRQDISCKSMQISIPRSNYFSGLKIEF
jgi:hypothetical protein